MIAIPKRTHLSSLPVIDCLVICMSIQYITPNIMQYLIQKYCIDTFLNAFWKSKYTISIGSLLSNMFAIVSRNYNEDVPFI